MTNLAGILQDSTPAVEVVAAGSATINATGIGLQGQLAFLPVEMPNTVYDFGRTHSAAKAILNW